MGVRPHIGFEVGLAASTVQAILNASGVGRLDQGDRATHTPKLPAQRYQRERPGELIHVDVKKLGGIPSGGGWRTRGRGYPGEGAKARMVGYRYLHSAIDDRTRIVYSEILDNEQASTAAGFWARAAAWYQSIGIPVERVITDNGPCYRSGLWHRACAATATTVNKTRPYRPQTNGKIERYHRILLEEWAYIRALDLRNPTGPRLHRVRAFLQSPPIPRSTRLGNPNQHPQGQPPRDAHLGFRSVRIRRDAVLDGHIQEWLNLFFRWFHVVAGVAWIGTSFYFNFLEDRLRPPEEDLPGVGGELWAVHGGGFYRVTKYSVAPDRLPGTLHWFKYEAYFTWLTGASLLAIVYYLGSSGLLVDPGTDVQEGAAIFLGVATLVLGWLVYDLACRTRLIGRPGYMSAAGIAVIAGVAYLLTRVMAPDAAYVHVGAMIGTWMAGNVFRVIIPSQKRMVAAMERGEEPDAADGRHAGIRSRHNNYLTLPVLFIMVSNHFPSTWSHSWNWVILGGLAVGVQRCGTSSTSAARDVATCGSSRPQWSGSSPWPSSRHPTRLVWNVTSRPSPSQRPKSKRSSRSDAPSVTPPTPHSRASTHPPRGSPSKRLQRSQRERTTSTVSPSSVTSCHLAISRV